MNALVSHPVASPTPWAVQMAAPLCKNCVPFTVSHVTCVCEVAASDSQLDLSCVVKLASHVGLFLAELAGVPRSAPT